MLETLSSGENSFECTIKLELNWIEIRINQN